MEPLADAPSWRPVSRTGWAVVGSVLLLAFVLRLGVVAEIRHGYVPKTDALAFDMIASSIADGHGFGPALVPPATGPTAYRAPLYPLSLSAVYKVVGNHKYTFGLLAQAGLGVLVVALIGVIAAQLFGRRVGLIALALAAIHPTLMLFGSSLQLEPLLMTLALASVATALHVRTRPQRVYVWLVLAGVLAGLTLLTRELGVAVLLPVLWLVWDGRRRWSRQALLAPVLVGVVAVLVVLPWTIRNEAQLHAFVPISTSSGYTLAGTYNQTAYASKGEQAFWIVPLEDPHLLQVLTRRAHPTEVQVDRDLRHESIVFARHHLGYMPKVWFWNGVRLFDLKGPADALFVARFLPYPPRLARLAVYASYLVGLLAIYGATRPVARRAPLTMWAIPLLALVTIVTLSGNIRYRASIEPFTVLRASVGVAAVADRLSIARRAS